MKVRYNFFLMVMGMLSIPCISQAVMLVPFQNLISNGNLGAYLCASNGAHYFSGCTSPKNCASESKIGVENALLPNKPITSNGTKLPSKWLPTIKNGYESRVSGQADRAALFDKALHTQAMVQRAWISSMVVPGLGQVYNQDYWKVPCLYLGFALVGSRIYSEHQEMNKHKRTLLLEEGADKPNPIFTHKRIKECERTRDLFIIIASAWYLLNILDAYAGGHDKTVNFKDDIGTKPASPPTAVLQPAAARPTAKPSLP